MKREFLIRKDGKGFYRENFSGYTDHAFNAGRYTIDQVIKVVYPNGPDKPPRSDMAFIDQDAFADDPISEAIKNSEKHLLEALKFVKQFAYSAMTKEHDADEMHLLDLDNLRFQRDCDIVAAREILNNFTKASLTLGENDKDTDVDVNQLQSEIEELKAKVEELEEYKYMYEDLCK